MAFLEDFREESREPPDVGLVPSALWVVPSPTFHCRTPRRLLPCFGRERPGLASGRGPRAQGCEGGGPSKRHLGPDPHLVLLKEGAQGKNSRIQMSFCGVGVFHVKRWGSKSSVVP